MKKDWVVTQEAFDGLLGWLDNNPEQAALKYEKIRARLIKIFSCRGWNEADELADETINRVTTKVTEIASSYVGDPAVYFYGVAQKVHLEYLRNRQSLNIPLDTCGELRSQHADESMNDSEQEYECLERCMDELPDDHRRLVIEYYQEEKRAKIERRRAQAEELGIALNALRIRAHRIRLQLQECVQHCLEQSVAH
jgi:DNA-directed RNA polymerase specialized sigma24 family protein